MQIRRSVIFALGIVFTIFEEMFRPLQLEFYTLHVKTLAIVYIATRMFQRGLRSWLEQGSYHPFLSNVQHAFCSQLTGLTVGFSWIVLMVARL